MKRFLNKIGDVNVKLALPLYKQVNIMEKTFFIKMNLVIYEDNNEINCSIEDNKIIYSDEIKLISKFLDLDDTVKMNKVTRLIKKVVTKKDFQTLINKINISIKKYVNWNLSDIEESMLENIERKVRILKYNNNKNYLDYLLIY